MVVVTADGLGDVVSPATCSAGLPSAAVVAVDVALATAGAVVVAVAGTGAAGAVCLVRLRDDRLLLRRLLPFLADLGDAKD